MADISKLPQPGVDGYTYLKPSLNIKAPINKAVQDPNNKAWFGEPGRTVLGALIWGGIKGGLKGGADAFVEIVKPWAEKPEGINRINNQNSAPSKTIYPKPGPNDVKFTIDKEATLRGAMFFPPTWEGNKAKQPVILVPPTGMFGGTAYEHNIAKLLKESGIANPMWLNIPGAMADWTWKNAEYVAYAIHYVYQRTGKKVALVAWSQGNLASQWALTWWPSTRALVNNFISIAADFHGTLTAYSTHPFETSPSILSQRYKSQLVTALREKGGDSAWVPHTSVYSSFWDEVVQPQFHSSWCHPSAYVKNAHKAGVTNVDLAVYPNSNQPTKAEIEWHHAKPGALTLEKKSAAASSASIGHFWGHGGPVLHPLVWEIIKDAISKGGPAQLDRIDTKAATSNQWGKYLSRDDRWASWKKMARFVSNLANFPRQGHEILAPYAQSKATKDLERKDREGKIPDMSKAEQEIIDHAKKYSMKYIMSGDPQVEVMVPSMFCVDTCHEQMEKQIQTGKAMKVPQCPGPRPGEKKAG